MIGGDAKQLFRGIWLLDKFTRGRAAEKIVGENPRGNVCSGGRASQRVRETALFASGLRAYYLVDAVRPRPCARSNEKKGYDERQRAH